MANQIKFQPVMGDATYIGPFIADNGAKKQPGQLVVNLDNGALYVVSKDNQAIPVGGISKAVTDKIDEVLRDIEEAQY